MQALTGSPIIRAWRPPSISRADLPILVSGHFMQLSVLDQHEGLTVPRLHLTHEDWVGNRFATDHRVCAARDRLLESWGHLMPEWCQMISRAVERTEHRG
jgi:hypothetical protein